MLKVLGSLKLSTLRDLCDKMKISYTEDKAHNSVLKKEYLMGLVEDWFVSKTKPKFWQKIKYPLFTGLMVSAIFFYITKQYDISNKQLRFIINAKNDKITILEQNTREILLTQKKIADQVFKKYDLLKSFFPKGYVVYTVLKSGESYRIDYPGEWMFNDGEVSFYKKPDGEWRINFEPNQMFRQSGRRITGNGKVDIGIDVNNQGLQNINFMPLGFTDGDILSLLILKNEMTNPIFAIGMSPR